MVAFGGKLLLAMYGSHLGASRLSAVWRLSAFWRVRYRRFHCSNGVGECCKLSIAKCELGEKMIVCVEQLGGGMSRSKIKLTQDAYVKYNS